MTDWWSLTDPAEREKGRLAHNQANREKLDRKLYVFDQDGTIYLDYEPLPGSVDFIRKLNEMQKMTIFITNNSSASAKTYGDKLSKILGFPVPEEMIYTSSLATINYLRSKQMAKVYALGTPDFESEMRENGFELTTENPQMIVLAFDKTLTYEKLETACNLIQNGIDYIATHPDKVCPTKDGYIPDTGSFIALIETATGKPPLKIIGKPNPEMVTTLLARYDLEPEDAIIFGDRLYTDIQLGKNSGIATALMLTGESMIQDIQKFGIVPDFVFKDMNEALDLLG